MMNRSHLIIPGVRKSGTTSIYNALIQHPNINEPPHKECYFFNLKETLINNNFEWYKRHYLHSKNYSIDASASYFVDDVTAELIAKYVPDTKILIMIRDPAKRLFSDFIHNVKKYNRIDKRHFSDIIRKMNQYTFETPEELVEIENSYVADSAKEGRIDESYMSQDYLSFTDLNIKASFRDVYFPYRYFQRSVYSYSISNYKNFFDSNVKIVVLEKLIKSPSEEMEEIFQFLGLKNEEISLEKSNPTIMINNLFTLILSKLLNIPFVNTLKSWIDKTPFRETYIKFLENLYSSPQMTEYQYNTIRNILSFEYDHWFRKDRNIQSLWRF